ncbi:MAG TPA: sugar ABC transporter permease [Gemmatimonadales bacterium]
MTAPGSARETRAGWAFTAPALLLIAVFFVLPALGALALSFTDFDIYSIGNPADTRFVGLGNYRDLLGNPVFWIALRNTGFFVLLGVPLSIALSLGAALLLNTRLGRWGGFFRTAYFTPYVTTLVAVAIVWRYLYHPQYGWVNATLGAVGIHPIDWLGSPRWAMVAIVLLSVWKGFGYTMVVFLAGLQSIPEELYEAGRLDGAGPWRQFRHITLPLLRPTFLFVAVITFIGYCQVFAEPYVMTQGGPLKSTTSIVLFMYEEGFRWWRIGPAAAIAVVLFLIMLVATAVQLRFRREEL